MNVLANEDPASKDELSWASITVILRYFGKHLPLLVSLAVIFAVTSLAICAVLPPRYEAEAVIGPPTSTAVETLLPGIAGFTSGGTAQAAAKKFLGGGGGSSSIDPFDSYLQLLRSMRLANVLVQNDQALQTIFASRWDAPSRSWKPAGLMHRLSSPLKGLFHRPDHSVPDVEDVKKFLDDNLGVANITAAGSSLLPISSPYYRVTFDFTSPQGGAQLLTTILREADDIIRQEERRDVSARLAFLNRKMPSVTVAEQRQTLIDSLSSQQQLEMMLEADKRFASSLIDPPFASQTPVYPRGPGFFLLVGVALSVVAWMTILFAAMRLKSVGRLVAAWERFIPGTGKRGDVA